MQLSSAKRYTAVILAALVLSACAERSQTTVSSLGQDDDAICRANNVVVGSPAYIACRKDRDALRDNAAGRADRRQRDLADYMMNHPDHP
jgi:hypothetical protein